MFVDIVWCSLPEPLILVPRSDIHLLSIPMTPVDLSICYELVPMVANQQSKDMQSSSSLLLSCFHQPNFSERKGGANMLRSPIPSRRKIAPTFVSTHLFHSKICKKNKCCLLNLLSICPKPNHDFSPFGGPFSGYRRQLWRKCWSSVAPALWPASAMFPSLQAFTMASNRSCAKKRYSRRSQRFGWDFPYLAMISSSDIKQSQFHDLES